MRPEIASPEGSSPRALLIGLTTLAGVLGLALVWEFGLEEVVLYASGSSARQTSMTKDRPVDATIMAIVDVLEVGGEIRYTKE